MKPKLFRVLLPVSNIETASVFYERILGVEGQRISPGRHYFDCDGTLLACYDPRADGDGYTAIPLSEWLYFAVDDLEAVFARCEQSGATFSNVDLEGHPLGKIGTRPWGERSFYITDPFGNKICFVDQATTFVGRQQNE